MRSTMCQMFVVGCLLVPVTAQAAVISTATQVGASMCWDEARQRLVLVRGSDVIEWDGQRWGAIGIDATAPVTALVYDSTRERVLGLRGSEFVAYDGHAFTVIGAVPVGFTNVNLFADAAAERVLGVPFGGTDVAVYAWDGGNWQLQAAQVSGHAWLGGAFDDVRRVLVAHLFAWNTQTPFETWEWDGVVWSQRAAEVATRGKLGFDPVTQRVLACNGTDTALWDGIAWTSVGVSRQPPQIVGMSPGAGGLWAFPAAANACHQVWFWNGSDWATIDATHPPQSSECDFTFDAARRRGVLYDVDRHFEWDGTRWLTMAMGTGPEQRMGRAQLYDPARQVTLVFGGATTGPTGIAHNDTWTWDGVAWTQVATTGPSPRGGAALTFDSARQRVVLVGGYTTTGWSPEQWEWDGAAWSLVDPAVPMGNAAGALGHDAARGRLVYVDEDRRTWEYDGIAWSLIGTGTLYPVRHRLVWDGGRQRLQGVLRGLSSNPRQYEWNGLQWIQVANREGTLAWDPTRGVMLVLRPDALATLTTLPATVVNYGTGCGGSATATTLTAFARPQPGERDFALWLRAEAALRPALVGFATDGATLPLGNGCALLLQNAIASRIWFTDASGLMRVPVPVPDVLGLRGFAFCAQGAVIDPASPGGVALTQGVRPTIGD